MQTLPPRLGFLVGSLWALSAAAASAQPAGGTATAEFFEKHVRPVLAAHCQSCHGPKKQMAGLRLDSAEAIRKGGDTGPVILLHHLEKSPLLRAIQHEGDVKMPPKGKLPPEAVEALAAWVKAGAPWPAAATVSVPGPANVQKVRQSHWAFQPVRRLDPPQVRDRAWARTPVDPFILAGLEARGLTPAVDAERRTLLRRVTLDLIGLPPTPEEVEAFVADPRPEAYALLIERLLASSQYGERWGRHWLDVARYADTRGYVFTNERRYPYSYTYRDYVVRAFNEDLPFDRFLLEQLAADQLPLGDDKRPLAAMGFLTLGRRFLNNVHDIIDDRIDVVTRGLLGLTVACARCHDHKYDPIPTKDYYALHGVFASSIEPAELPTIVSPEQTPDFQRFQRELAVLQQAVKAYEAEHAVELKSGNRKHRDELRRLQKRVDGLRVTHPGSPPQAMVLVDAPRPTEPVVFLRGNPNNRGEAVPRRFLEVLSPPNRKPFAAGSGRLELARAIANRDNPLTARVFVNRVWQQHFGTGLVRTPGDFGLRGEPPSHPELLDYLATAFVDSGWSVKQLHRLLLLSRTYQQASVCDERTAEADPENRLFGRMNRRRLEFEALRDSVLAVAGQLDPARGGPPVEITTAPFTRRRTVYSFIDRQNLPGVFRTFDLASPDITTAQRHSTTVPQQALFLLNSPFLLEQAAALARRPDLAALEQPRQRIEQLYRLLFGRVPDGDELRAGEAFLREAASTAAWEQYAQVLLLANEFAFVD